MSITSIANSEPKYLGCKVSNTTDKKIHHDEYYFLSVKDGRGRFLKYIAYPLWCRASDVSDLLDVSKPVSDNILEEVHSFILGKLLIEITPKKRGRSEKIVKTNLGATNNVNNIRRSVGSIINVSTESLGNGGGGSIDGEVRIENRLSEPGSGSSNLPQRRGKPIAKNASQASHDKKVQQLTGGGKTKDSGTVWVKSIPIIATYAPPAVAVVERQKRVRRTKLQMEEARRAETMAQMPKVVKPVKTKGKRNK